LESAHILPFFDVVCRAEPVVPCYWPSPAPGSKTRGLMAARALFRFLRCPVGNSVCLAVWASASVSVASRGAGRTNKKCYRADSNRLPGPAAPCHPRLLTARPQALVARAAENARAVMRGLGGASAGFVTVLTRPRVSVSAAPRSAERTDKKCQRADLNGLQVATAPRQPIALTTRPQALVARAAENTRVVMAGRVGFRAFCVICYRFLSYFTFSDFPHFFISRTFPFPAHGLISPTSRVFSLSRTRSRFYGQHYLYLVPGPTWVGSPGTSCRE
jgi:hypothetical protein